MQLKHLALLLSVPLAIATATGLASGPIKIATPEPEDDHTRPAEYNEPTLPDELIPIPSQNHAEYPLAVAFNPADPSNYTPGGIVSHDYVVVHTMQGYYYGAQSWFQNPAANVSAHFCMRSDDGEVTQMVHLADRAWHVGGSNSYAIGIEHEGFVDEPAWYTWETYSSSAMLARWLADALDIPRTRDHIVGHVELPNQTHTDPGIHWNWDLYMTLINDFVSEGVIEGHVVDRGQACTLTATGDTWIKQTLQASADLDDTQKCFIPAGTQFEYLHASADLLGHRRLRYDADGHPCGGFLGLEEQGFAYAGHYSALCEETSMAAAGVTVVLDGGAQTVTDATGKFVFTDVAPGAHSLDVLGNGSYADTIEPVDLDVYPGTRVVIALDPLGGPGDGDGDPGDGDGDPGDGDPGECWIGGENCPCTPGGGCDPGLVCELGTCVPTGEDGPNGDSGETGITDPGIDYLEADTCSCSETQERPGLLALALLGLLGLRRSSARTRYPSVSKS
ncbi:MAG TPA: N-acetylmuramoyl-L-alanine amidase [Enhygromyxa sp.]|nr:N-acetylmuramoyl-L-alanine amidase [Enhygromyxa sp.]